jgi:hypothetical protein
MSKITINRKEKKRQDAKAKHGTLWVDAQGDPIDPDHIVAVWDAYCDGKCDADTLQGHFPGRTHAAIQAKVYRITGRRRSPDKTHNPDQEDLFRNQLGSGS